MTDNSVPSPSNDGKELATSKDASSKDSVSLFLESLGKLVPEDKAKLYLRANHQGVFLQKEFLEPLVEYYQAWFKQLTAGGEVSQSKVIKRLFTSLKPTLYYLVEAKQCLVGYLLKRPVAQPELLGIPVYLGTVDDTRRTFHPRDPLLLCLPQIELSHQNGEQQFSIETRAGTFIFSQKLLIEFVRLTQRSEKFAQEFGETSLALRDALKTIIAVLEKSSLVKNDARILVPFLAQGHSNVKFLCHHTLTFVVDTKNQARPAGPASYQAGHQVAKQPANRITHCYDVGGKLLSRFIKTEAISLFGNPQERRRSIMQMLPPHSREIASFQIGRHTALLQPSVLAQFIRAIRHSELDSQNFPQRYSIKDCLLEFSNILQLAQDISRDKIARQVAHVRARNLHYKISSRWIFAVDKRGRLIACVDRFQGGGFQAGGVSHGVHRGPARGNFRRGGRR